MKNKMTLFRAAGRVAKKFFSGKKSLLWCVLVIGVSAVLVFWNRPSETSIKIASWNVLRLDDDKSLDKLAEVISRYDIVGIQEVKSSTVLDSLKDQVATHTPGVIWSLARTENPVGTGRAAEYYGFIYRTDRVLEVNDGAKGVYPEPDPDGFSREPYYATFKSGNFDFTLINIHVTWGNGGSDIRNEVQKLDQVWTCIKGLSGADPDIVLMGDFNLNGPNHPSFGNLRNCGAKNLITGQDTKTTYSTKPDTVWANWYDNMWYDPNYTAYEYTGNNGVDTIHERYYGGNHLKVRREISDHVPVWAEFITSKTDDD